MTVTDLDPPSQRPAHLRLVASNAAPASRDHRYRAGAKLGAPARRLYRAVLRAGLEAGIPVDPDALRVVLAVKQARDVGPISRFTAAAIWQLVFVDVVNWCRARHLETPADSVVALRAILDRLNATDGFAAGSDHVNALYAALDECTGGGWVDPKPPSLPGRPQRSVRSQRGSKRT